MRKMLIFAFVLILLSSVNAVVIEFTQVPDTIYTLEKTEIKFKITNDGSKKDTYYIGVWPTNWVMLEKYFVILNPGESEIVSFVVEPPIDSNIGNVIFTVTARSTDTKDYGSNDVVLNIRRRTGTYISQLKLNQEILKPGDTLVIQPLVVNLDKTQSKRVIISAKIFKEDKLIKSIEEEALIQPASTKTVSFPFEVKNIHTYGTYNVQVFMTDVYGSPIHSKSASFVIKKFDNFQENKYVDYGFLESTFTINITNKGNVPGASYIVTESMPKISKYFFYPEKEPDLSETTDNRVVYSWKISGLDPDETATIKYKLRFTNVAIAIFLSLLLISLIITIFHKPTLMKKYSSLIKPDKETLITLHVKNNSIRDIENIIVKDTIPSVFAIIKEFDTLKPEVKTTQTGTVLLWKIDKLKPKEDRVLTYKIKPVVNIEGKPKLPKAHFSYKLGKTIIHKVAEKIVLFSKRVK
ncbi:MAG: hypothetical protein QXM68_00205 [Candidatus Aenigmatarchaeota archaeon]|nr:hypothetical protein [Candidatus Aenigmarchaeota archaeon]